MLDINIKRIPFSASATARLASLRSKIVIKENNILCRIGFTLSLEEAGMPLQPDSLDGSTIDRFTLLGEYDKVFIALLITWMQQKELEITDDNLSEYFVRHMNRGVDIISTRVKSMSDFESLTPEGN